MVLSSILSISLVSIGLIFTSYNQLETMANENGHGSSCNWNHYLSLEPSLDNNGNKEYYICCNHNTYTFDRPIIGNISEPKYLSTDFLNSLDNNDERVVLSYSKQGEILNNKIESIAVNPEEARYRAWSYNFINTIYKKTGGAGVQGRSLEVEYWNIDKNEKALRKLYELFNGNLSKKKQNKILKNIMVSTKEESSQIESIILNNVDGLNEKDQEILQRGEEQLSTIFDTLKEYQRDSNSQITNKGDVSLKTQSGPLYLELKNITAGGAGVSAAQTITVNIYTISKNLKELVKNGINDEVVKQIQNNSEGMVFKRSEEKYSNILKEIYQDAIKNTLF